MAADDEPENGEQHKVPWTAADDIGRGDDPPTLQEVKEVYEKITGREEEIEVPASQGIEEKEVSVSPDLEDKIDVSDRIDSMRMNLLVPGFLKKPEKVREADGVVLMELASYRDYDAGDRDYIIGKLQACKEHGMRVPENMGEMSADELNEAWTDALGILREYFGILKAEE